MSQVTIVESGMTFGPFDAKNCFQIESSVTYKGVGEGIKIAEFLLLKNNAVWIVEAKSSIPRVTDSYFEEIRQKLSNALILSVAASLGRHNVLSEPTTEFRTCILSDRSIKLVLVVGPIPSRFMKPLTDDLRGYLKHITKLWGKTEVWVLNKEEAVNRGLVQVV